MLDLPHDWSIDGTFSKDHPVGVGGGALPGDIGWYLKSFTMPVAYSTKLHFINFGKIYRNSEVWINGHHLGKRPNGYISFRYDLTPYFKFGGKENVIAVRVDNSQQPNSRWYSGSSIYRNVWLVTTCKLHVDHWGNYITTPKITESSASVEIKTNLVSQFQGERPYTLTTSIVNPEGNQIALAMRESGIIADSATVQQHLIVDNPQLWSVHNPTLYKVVTVVESEGTVLDRYETTFGIRDFHFDRDEGFFLNGEHTKILGVCEHHDPPAPELLDGLYRNG